MTFILKIASSLLNGSWSSNSDIHSLGRKKKEQEKAKGALPNSVSPIYLKLKEDWKI